MRRKVFVILFLILFAGIAIIALVQPKTSTSTTPSANVESYEFYEPIPTSTVDISMIQGNADINFPPSAREIHGYTEGFREVYSEVRFDMNAVELEEFLTDTLCNIPLVQISPY